MFGATNIVKNSDKDKWVYSGYGIVIDGGDWGSFNNGSARNVKIFGADNSFSSVGKNLKINFLILGLGPRYGINESFDKPEKKISINLLEFTL